MKRSRVEDSLIIRKDEDVVKEALKGWSTSKSNMFNILVEPGFAAIA